MGILKAQFTEQPPQGSAPLLRGSILFLGTSMELTSLVTNGRTCSTRLDVVSTDAGHRLDLDTAFLALYAIGTLGRLSPSFGQNTGASTASHNYALFGSGLVL